MRLPTVPYRLTTGAARPLRHRLNLTLAQGGAAAREASSGNSPHTAPSASHYARITVRDTGIGIPADSLAEVLRPFRQVQNHLTRGRSGSGLGLAIASGLAEAMGGTLTLDSTVGVGTVATVVLPVAGGMETDPARDARPVAREGAKPVSA